MPFWFLLSFPVGSSRMHAFVLFTGKPFLNFNVYVKFIDASKLNVATAMP